LRWNIGSTSAFATAQVVARRKEYTAIERLSVMGMARFWSVSMIVALVGIFCPSYAGRAGRMLCLKGGSPAATASVANGADEALKKVSCLQGHLCDNLDTSFSLKFSTNFLYYYIFCAGCKLDKTAIESTRLCHKKFQGGRDYWREHRFHVE